MRRVFQVALKVLAGLLVVVMLGYLGACVYGNWIAKPEGTVSLPPVDKAAYVLTVKNTGTAILASEVRQTGPDIIGQRVFSLPAGYWEMAKGGKFKYIKFSLTMEEDTWGEIDVTKRRE